MTLALKKCAEEVKDILRRLFQEAVVCLYLAAPHLAISCKMQKYCQHLFPTTSNDSF